MHRRSCPASMAGAAQRYDHPLLPTVQQWQALVNYAEKEERFALLHVAHVARLLLPGATKEARKSVVSRLREALALLDACQDERWGQSRRETIHAHNGQRMGSNE